MADWWNWPLVELREGDVRNHGQYGKTHVVIFQRETEKGFCFCFEGTDIRVHKPIRPFAKAGWEGPRRVFRVSPFVQSILNKEIPNERQTD